LRFLAHQGASGCTSQPDRGLTAQRPPGSRARRGGGQRVGGARKRPPLPARSVRFPRRRWRLYIPAVVWPDDDLVEERKQAMNNNILIENGVLHRAGASPFQLTFSAADLKLPFPGTVVVPYQTPVTPESDQAVIDRLKQQNIHDWLFLSFRYPRREKLP